MDVVMTECGWNSVESLCTAVAVAGMQRKKAWKKSGGIVVH